MQGIGKSLWKFIDKAVYVCLDIFYKILGKELSDKTVSVFLQFVKFGIVGLSNTAVSYILYTVSLLGFKKFEILGEKDYLAAQMISFALSVLWSFYWNNKAVFVLEDGKQRSVWKALLKTYVSYSFTGLFLNTVLLYIWVNQLHISEFIAPLINLLVSVPVNFIINKKWAFKNE